MVQNGLDFRIYLQLFPLFAVQVKSSPIFLPVKYGTSQHLQGCEDKPITKRGDPFATNLRDKPCLSIYSHSSLQYHSELLINPDRLYFAKLSHKS